MSKSLTEGLNEFYTEQTEAGQTLIEGNRPWGKRIKSIALAVHPDQVEEATKDAVARGVPTEFTADGRPILTDRNHRKQYMKAYGYFDRDAGYGDAQPQHHKGDTPPPSRLRELAKKYADRIRLRHKGA